MAREIADRAHKKSRVRCGLESSKNLRQNERGRQLRRPRSVIFSSASGARCSKYYTRTRAIRRLGMSCILFEDRQHCTDKSSEVSLSCQPQRSWRFVPSIAVRWRGGFAHMRKRPVGPQKRVRKSKQSTISFGFPPHGCSSLLKLGKNTR
jgi:hypothetical protein